MNKKEFIEACGGDLGVPCFFSTKTKEAMCGECSYSVLKKWVKENG